MDAIKLLVQFYNESGNVGAGKPERVKTGVASQAAVGVAGGLVLGAVLWIFAEAAMGAFTTNEVVIATGSQALRVLAFFYWTMALQHCFIGAILGIGRTSFLMIVSVVIVIVRIPVAYWLGIYSNNFFGLYQANVITNLVACTLLGFFYFKVRKLSVSAQVNADHSLNLTEEP